MEDADGFVSITSREKKAGKAAAKKAKSTAADAVATAAATTTSATAAALVQGEEKEGTTMDAHAIQEVVLVGGSSRVPAVRAAIRRAFGDLGIVRFSPDGKYIVLTSLRFGSVDAYVNISLFNSRTCAYLLTNHVK
jgi:hypothetical protein